MTTKPNRFRLNHAEYVLDRRPGEGGQAEVYQGVERHIKGYGYRQVAIKVLRLNPKLGSASLQFERMRREGELGFSLQHSNIIRVYDHGVVDLDGRRTYAVVMEYYEGRTLHAHIAACGRLRPIEVACIAFQASTALLHLHEHGFVSRDVTAKNILCRLNPLDLDPIEIKLIDLGLAKAFRSIGVPEQIGVAAPELETEVGQLPGTGAYLAPEAFDRGPPAPSWDWYSLGVALWHCLFGRLHFDKPNRRGLDHPETASHYAQLFDTILPSPLCRIVDGLLSPEPLGRLQGAAVRDMATEAIRSLQLDGGRCAAAADLASSLIQDSGGWQTCSMSCGQIAPEHTQQQSRGEVGASSSLPGARVGDACRLESGRSHTEPRLPGALPLPSISPREPQSSVASTNQKVVHQRGPRPRRWLAAAALAALVLGGGALAYHHLPVDLFVSALLAEASSSRGTVDQREEGGAGVLAAREEDDAQEEASHSPSVDGLPMPNEERPDRRGTDQARPWSRKEAVDRLRALRLRRLQLDRDLERIIE